MKHPRRRSLTGLRQAFDEVRFGAAKTLNLRESLPTAVAATARAEAWLRQAQVDRADEVLVVTGRGNQSEGGIGVVRQAVDKLLHQLKRSGVVASHREYTEGSFVVNLAPVRTLWEAPRRNRGRGAKTSPSSPTSLAALDPDSLALLRELALRSLHDLGVKDEDAFIEGEMLRQFSALAASIGQAPDRERLLRAAIRAAIDQRD
jgi:hypothetical protein